MTLLVLDEVRKGYGRGRNIPVLDGVSFELDRGEFAAIYGQRASGKTTLLRIAAGLLAPDSGSVLLNKRELPVMRPSWRGAMPDGIGWVRQGGPSVRVTRMLDYVAWPLLRETSYAEALRRATAALERMRAIELAQAQWHDLSHGERQLIEIAHAIVREPHLLLADDPTASLDLREREIVAKLIREVIQDQGMAVLMSVPDVPDVLLSDRVMSLNAGRLIQAEGRSSGGTVTVLRRRDQQSR